LRLLTAGRLQSLQESKDASLTLSFFVTKVTGTWLLSELLK